MRSLSNCCGLLASVLLLSLPSFSEILREPASMMPTCYDGDMDGMRPDPRPMVGGSTSEIVGYCPDANDPTPSKFLGSWMIDIEGTRAVNPQFELEEGLEMDLVMNWSPVDPSTVVELLNGLAVDNQCAVAVLQMGIPAMSDFTIPFAVIKDETGYKFGAISEGLENHFAPFSISLGESEDDSDDRLSFVEGTPDHVIMKRAPSKSATDNVIW